MSIDVKSPMGPGEVNELIGRIRELEAELNALKYDHERLYITCTDFINEKEALKKEEEANE